MATGGRAGIAHVHADAPVDVGDVPGCAVGMAAVGGGAVGCPAVGATIVAVGKHGLLTVP